MVWPPSLPGGGGVLISHFPFLSHALALYNKTLKKKAPCAMLRVGTFREPLEGFKHAVHD